MAESSSSIERVRPPKWYIRAMAPVVRTLTTRSKTMAKYMLVLHFTGRRTGRKYQPAVAYWTEDDRLMVLTNDAWRWNFEGGRDLEVTYLRKRQSARGTLESDKEPLCQFYQHKFTEVGPRKIAADFGMKINLGREPTPEEWLNALEREGMSRVWIDLTGL